ncbi:MAG: PAS domain S-box protein [Desulfovibrionales bacterium]
MKIKTMLRIIGSLSILMVLSIALTLIFSVNETNRADQDREQLQEIITGIFDLNLLIHDLLHTPGERDIMQWNAQYETVFESIRTYPLRNPANAPIYEQIRKNYIEMGQLFQELLLRYPDGGVDPAGLTEIRRTLAGQVLIKSQTVKTEAQRLLEIKTDRLNAIRYKTNLLIMALVLITAIIIVLNTLFLNRFISNPVLALFSATNRIAEGDLDARVQTGRTSSEINRLAESFNNMAFRLKENRERLQDEILSRQKAETRLQTTLEQLEDTIRDRTSELRERNRELWEQVALRKDRENEANRERNRFYSLLNSLPAYIFLVNKDKKIVYTNKYFQERFGPVEDKTCHQILHCRSTPCPSCHVDEIFATGNQATREFEAPHGRWYRVYDYLFQDEEGSPLVLELGIDITESKNAKEVLARREQQYKALVENAPDVISRINRDFIYMYINPAVETITGKPPDFYLGKSVSEIGFSPENSRSLVQKIENVFATRRIETFEHEFDTRFGSRFLHMRISPELTRHGKVETVLAITRDITSQKKMERELLRSRDILEEQVRKRTAKLTEAVATQKAEIRERKRIQRALKESEQKFRLTFDQSPIGTALLDLEYRFVSVNDSFCRITGYSREELVNRSFTEITHPEDIPSDLELVGRLRKGVIPGYQKDKRYIHKNGSTVWVRLSAGMLHNQSGKPLHLLSMVEDITERKLAEEALRIREEEYRALVENAPDMIARYDSEMTILYINPVVKEYLGREPSSYIGRKLTEFISLPENLDMITRAFEEVLKTGNGQVLENEIPGPEGESRYFLTRLHPESFDNGNVKTVLALSHDITHLKRLEQELRQVSRAKSDFLANMSHELRTPISGILGITEMDLTRDLPREIRTDLEMIKISASSLIHIINDLLDLARIEAGRIELHISDFSPSELLQKIIRSCRADADSKGLSLTYEMAPDIPGRVQGDPNRLGQILKNLIGNAVKFTEKGSIHVSAGVEKKEKGALTLFFSVKDTGIGIPQDKQNMLFQSFMQLDPSISKKYGGAGLGLVISKQLVQMMNGSIWVESEPGEGTTFSFTVQVAPSTETEVSLKKENVEKLASIPQLRILLAEDNMVNQVFLKRFLTQAGHEVVSAANGKEALDQMQSNDFDLVLMDIQMPEIDGLEATRRIREDGSKTMNSSVPIIALTAYAMKGDRERFLASGMNDYVTKPVDFDFLAGAILRWIHEG